MGNTLVVFMLLAMFVMQGLVYQIVSMAHGCYGIQGGICTLLQNRSIEMAEKKKISITRKGGKRKIKVTVSKPERKVKKTDKKAERRKDVDLSGYSRKYHKAADEVIGQLPGTKAHSQVNSSLDSYRKKSDGYHKDSETLMGTNLDERRKPGSGTISITKRKKKKVEAKKKKVKMKSDSEKFYPKKKGRNNG
jgi:hypothetical protein